MGMRWDSLDKIYMRIQRKTSDLSEGPSVGASLEDIIKAAKLPSAFDGCEDPQQIPDEKLDAWMNKLAEQLCK